MNADFWLGHQDVLKLGPSSSPGRGSVKTRNGLTFFITGQDTAALPPSPLT